MTTTTTTPTTTITAGAAKRARSPTQTQRSRSFSKHSLASSKLAASARSLVLRRPSSSPGTRHTQTSPYGLLLSIPTNTISTVGLNTKFTCRNNTNIFTTVSTVTKTTQTFRLKFKFYNWVEQTDSVKFSHGPLTPPSITVRHALYARSQLSGS